MTSEQMGGTVQRNQVATDLAIDVVARAVIASGVEWATAVGQWDNYPEIGEHDWERITKRASELAQWPRAEVLKQSYDHLAERAGMHCPECGSADVECNGAQHRCRSCGYDGTQTGRPTSADGRMGP